MTHSWMLRMFVLLMAGHALCDYPLQGQFLSEAKARKWPACPWWIALTAHSFIHCGMVLLITDRLDLALAEFICHWIIDWRKGVDGIDFDVDQALHLACKVAWVLIAFTLPAPF